MDDTVDWQQRLHSLSDLDGRGNGAPGNSLKSPQPAASPISYHCAMQPKPPKLAAVLQALKKHYGVPETLPTKDPFELILWENVAYLAPPARRRAAFALLHRQVGLSPDKILTASRAALERVTAHGILKARFANKLRECARIALEGFGADLGAVLREPLPQAKKALRRFPGIGEPGADKILLFAGVQNVLAPDSNALRVLMRLGIVAEDKSYARMYAASRNVGAKPALKIPVMQQAHLLLKLHGQTLCKRSAPLCGACPLAARRLCPIGINVISRKHM
jgi:endonuclease-3